MIVHINQDPAQYLSTGDYFKRVMTKEGISFDTTKKPKNPEKA